MDVKEEHILGDDLGQHWYYISKGRALARFVRGLPRGTIVDVGAGSGIFSKMLLDQGWRNSICVDPAYTAEQTIQYNDKPIRFVRSLDDEAADLVLMMDVCEHVEDDVDLIRGYANQVAAGTHFLITVPAFQFLFSSHDVFLEHWRRYTIPLLEDRVAKAGLDVIQSRYYFATIFPLAVAARLVAKVKGKLKNLEPKSDLRMHSKPLNTLLAGSCRLELPFLAFNRAFGLSAFCLARKPK